MYLNDRCHNNWSHSSINNICCNPLPSPHRPVWLDIVSELVPKCVLMSLVTHVNWKYSAKVLGGIKQSVLAEEILFISSNGYLAPLLRPWSLEITRTLSRELYIFHQTDLLSVKWRRIESIKIIWAWLCTFLSSPW